MQVVGIVSAGAMGSALGARLRDGGARVVVALDGRSERTRRAGSGRRARGRRLARVARPRGRRRPLRRAARCRGRRRGGDRRRCGGSARPLVVDLNAVAPPTVLRIEAALAACGDRRGGRLDLRPASGHAGDDPRLPLGPAGGRGGRASAGRCRPRRRVGRRRRGVGGEDVHRVGLQGTSRASHPGPPHGSRTRRGRACARRSRGDGRRRSGAGGCDGRPGVGEGVAVRRRDGGDRRDPGGRRPHARALPRVRHRLRGARGPRRRAERRRTSRTTPISRPSSPGSHGQVDGVAQSATSGKPGVRRERPSERSVSASYPARRAVHAGPSRPIANAAVAKRPRWQGRAP